MNKQITIALMAAIAFCIVGLKLSESKWLITLNATSIGFAIAGLIYQALHMRQQKLFHKVRDEIAVEIAKIEQLEKLHTNKEMDVQHVLKGVQDGGVFILKVEPFTELSELTYRIQVRTRNPICKDDKEALLAFQNLTYYLLYNKTANSWTKNI